MQKGHYYLLYKAYLGQQWKKLTWFDDIPIPVLSPGSVVGVKVQGIGQSLWPRGLGPSHLPDARGGEHTVHLATGYHLVRLHYGLQATKINQGWLKNDQKYFYTFKTF